MPMNLLDKLIILNDTDRPCMYLVCREFSNGKIIYVNEYLRRRYPELKKGEGSNSLIDFGFIYEDGTYKLRNKSKAKSPLFGLLKWQGRKEFTYKDIKHFNGRSENE